MRRRNTARRTGLCESLPDLLSLGQLPASLGYFRLYRLGAAIFTLLDWQLARWLLGCCSVVARYLPVMLQIQASPASAKNCC